MSARHGLPAVDGRRNLFMGVTVMKSFGTGTIRSIALNDDWYRKVPHLLTVTLLLVTVLSSVAGCAGISTETERRMPARAGFGVIGD